MTEIECDNKWYGLKWAEAAIDSESQYDLRED